MSFKKKIGFSGFVLLFNFVATAHAQNLDQSKLDAIIHLDEMKIDIVNNHPKIYIHKIISDHCVSPNIKSLPVLIALMV